MSGNNRESVPSDARKQFAELSFDEMRAVVQRHQDARIEVTVGNAPNSVAWHLPKALLSQYSEFFRAACNQPFKEKDENKIPLSDCQPALFELFVQWLYCRALPVNFFDESGTGVWKGFRLWVLGDRLMAEAFQNCAMEHIYQEHVDPDCALYASEVQYCWENSPPTSKLREFVLDHVVQGWSTGTYSFSAEDEEDEWKDCFSAFPDFRDGLLLRIAVPEKAKTAVKRVEAYLETEDQRKK